MRTPRRRIFAALAVAVAMTGCDRSDNARLESARNEAAAERFGHVLLELHLIACGDLVTQVGEEKIKQDEWRAREVDPQTAKSLREEAAVAVKTGHIRCPQFVAMARFDPIRAKVLGIVETPKGRALKLETMSADELSERLKSELPRP